MLQLIDHIVFISACRDRSEVNRAMLQAIRDLFEPYSATIYRCFASAQQTVAFKCSGIGAGGDYQRNAYLPEDRYCVSLDSNPGLLYCQDESLPYVDVKADGATRWFFPIRFEDKLCYILEIEFTLPASDEQMVTLAGLVNYFRNQVALIDYGETDTLTGLSNRKTFDKHLYEVLGQASVDAAQLSTTSNGTPARRKGDAQGRHWLAVCDIDHFKHVNDNFGHLIGDEVLVTFSRLIQMSFRYDDQLFRFGGEEFIVVLQPAGQRHVHTVFNRLRRRVEAHHFGGAGHVTLSIGYSQLLPNDTPSSIVGRADEALYYAKQNGRNQVCCYESLIHQGKIAAKQAVKSDIEFF